MIPPRRQKQQQLTHAAPAKLSPLHQQPAHCLSPRRPPGFPRSHHLHLAFRQPRSQQPQLRTLPRPFATFQRNEPPWPSPAHEFPSLFCRVIKYLITGQIRDIPDSASTDLPANNGTIRGSASAISIRNTPTGSPSLIGAAIGPLYSTVK